MSIQGKLKRMHWLITDWYRTQGYYQQSSWHSTWKTDGGGVILNQCPHNLDLLQWICGMPSRVQAFCHYRGRPRSKSPWTFFGRSQALIICENGKLKIAELKGELGMTEKKRLNLKESLKKLWAKKKLLTRVRSFRATGWNRTNDIRIFRTKKRNLWNR